MRKLRCLVSVVICVAVTLACVYPVALSDTEPDNNVRHRAEAIQPGTYGGTVGGADEEDWYKFPVTGGDIIRVNLEPGSSDEVIIRLRDNEDSGLASCKPDEPLTYLTTFELGRRNWYLVVTGQGAYRFTLQTVQQNDAGTGQDAPAAFHRALPISGGLLRGMLGDDDEHDYFRFSAAAGQTIVIEFRADFSRFAKDMGGISLHLLSPDDSQLTSVASYGDKETLEYGPLGEDEAGEMRLLVSGEGDYEFAVPLLGAGRLPAVPEVTPGAPPTAPSTAQPAPGVSQPPGGGQSTNFAGSGQLRFFLPVRGTGTIEARAQWAPQVAAAVALFSPSQKLPVAQARGTCSVSLSYTISAGGAAPSRMGNLAARLGIGRSAAQAAGKVLGSVDSGGGEPREWMLLITPLASGTAIQGQLSVQFPGSESGRLEWRPFTPHSPLGRAFLGAYLSAAGRLTSGAAPADDFERRVQQNMARDANCTAALSGGVQAYRAMSQAQQLSVTASSPDIAGQLRTHPGVTINPGQMRPSDQQPTGPAPLTVRFNHIFCASETTWDQLSDSDEMYYLIGLVGPNGRATGYMSREFGDFDSNEARPAMGVAAQDVIWQGELTGDTFCVLALVEHDYSNRDEVYRSFLSSLEGVHADALEAARDIAAGAGDTGLAGSAVGAFGDAAQWAADNLIPVVGEFIADALDALFGEVVKGMRDDIIGQPVVLHINPQQAVSWEHGSGFVWKPVFRGAGARYDLVFTLGRPRDLRASELPSPPPGGGSGSSDRPPTHMK